MAGRLYRMAKVVSANPASWGIVDANQISGFRTVAKLTDLYSIAACILSSSYGDGTTTGADAIGQIWHVQEGGGKDYRLTSWANRGTSAGWTMVDYADATTVDDRLTKVETKAATNANNIDKLNTTVSEHTQSIKENSDRIGELRSNKAEHSEVTAIDDKLTAFKNTKGQAEGIASLGKDGRVPMDQLPLIDNTLYELVDVLPSTLATINKNHIYLMKATTTDTKNVYAEYIYTGTSATYDDTKWEKLGEVTASVDLSDYYTKSQTDHEINKSRIRTVAIGSLDGTAKVKVRLTEANGTEAGIAEIPVVTPNVNGLMSPTMLTKLNGIKSFSVNDVVAGEQYSLMATDGTDAFNVGNIFIRTAGNGNTEIEAGGKKTDINAIAAYARYDINGNHIDATYWKKADLVAISNDELTSIFV